MSLSPVPNSPQKCLHISLYLGYSCPSKWLCVSLGEGCRNHYPIHAVAVISSGHSPQGAYLSFSQRFLGLKTKSGLEIRQGTVSFYWGVAVFSLSVNHTWFVWDVETEPPCSWLPVSVASTDTRLCSELPQLPVGWARADPLTFLVIAVTAPALCE